MRAPITDLATVAANPARLADASVEELAALAGEAAALHARILARIVTPVAVSIPTEQEGQRKSVAEPKPLVTVAEVAVTLGVDRMRVYELARTHQIPSVRLGRSIRFAPQRIEEWIAAGGTNGDGNASFL